MENNHPEKITRRNWSWTTYRVRQPNQVVDVVKALADYWPLTLPQIYYRLVAAGHIENTRSKYNDLSKLVRQMRLDDLLPWACIEDRTRYVTEKRGVEDKNSFIEEEVDNFL